MSNLNKKPILIFGATGSIGIAAAKTLKKNKNTLLLSNSNENEYINQLPLQQIQLIYMHLSS